MKVFSTQFMLDRLGLAVLFATMALACWLCVTGASPWLAGTAVWAGWLGAILLMGLGLPKRKRPPHSGMVAIAIVMAVLLVIFLGMVNVLVSVTISLLPSSAQVFDFVLYVMFVCSVSPAVMLFAYLVYLEIHKRVGKGRTHAP